MISAAVRYLGLMLGSWASLLAHSTGPVTHSFDAGKREPGPRLQLRITDAATGRPLAARFSLKVDGHTYEPAWIDGGGLRFKSIHRTKRQEFVATYARGMGEVNVALPETARHVEVVACRGFEYLPARGIARREGDRFMVELTLRRWVDFERAGWIAVEEHVHYDRLDPAADGDWLAVLEADGLATGHFLVAKGGMMPGMWAAQHTYGPKGHVGDGRRTIVPGEEYRDLSQGHINLLGIGEIIEPISTGGLGTPTVAENFPPLHDVLQRARATGGLAGVAHGGTLSRVPTALTDAVLGACDFWEISNGFIYSTDAWYRLMNCGIFIPPMAGTDLPNDPFRDPWQPLFGSVRTYVQTGGKVDFAAFKSALVAGRVFITGGPLIEIAANDQGPGETIHLPPSGGTVTVRASLRSPQSLRTFELVRDGRAVAAEVRRTKSGGIDEWQIEQKLLFNESGWVAASGTGVRIAAQGIDARAHSGVVRVRVGEKPVRFAGDVAWLSAAITKQREHYAREGRYRSESDRAHALALFDRALARLREF